VKPCKDCVQEDVSGVQAKNRPAPHPGPRCTTHHRAFRKQQKKVNHERTVMKTYGLKLGGYGQLYQAQGGVCAICRRATGQTKRLAVDHDHETGLVRGLLCGPCNKLVGYFRNSPEAFRRAAEYLEHAQERNYYVESTKQADGGAGEGSQEPA
jgi:hypothetical protein